MSAPTKISARVQFAGYVVVLRIVSKAGSSKDLYSKVYKTCGKVIKISEDDTRSEVLSVLCRSSVTFVDKMDQFTWRAQSMNNTLSRSDVNSEYSVQRCVQLSPSSHQQSKRISKDMPPFGRALMWISGNKKGVAGLHDFILFYFYFISFAL